jgi:hypothetical protein
MRQLRAVLGAVLLAVALVATVGGRPDEARAPVAGVWKVSVYLAGQDIALAIVKVEVKDGKAEAEVVATGAKTFAGARVVAAAAGERSLHVTFRTATSTFQVAAYGRKDERRPKVLTGSLEVRNNFEVVTLERTTERELDQANPATPAEGADDLKKLLTKDDKERDSALAAILEKHAGKGVAYAAAVRVWQHYAQEKYGYRLAAEQGEKFVRVAAGFGREMELHANAEVARGLTDLKDGAEKAVEFARRAEKLLTDADSPRRQLAVLRTLAAALRRTDAGDGAALREVKDRIARIDDLLDAEFEKTVVPFKLEPFAGRKEKSSRVAVVELFTSAQSAKCVAANIVFDALLRTYKPTEVILLRYHLHGRQSDPIANPDGELTGALYKVDEVPTVLVNGKAGPKLGGTVTAEAGYKEMTALLNQSLEGTAKAGLDLAAKRDGDTLTVTATLTALPDRAAARLRVLLVEDVVRYQGSGGHRLHHHVVRAVLADEKTKLPKGDATPRKFTVSLAELRKKLAENLEKVHKEDPFPDDERPLELKRLKVVALVQDEGSNEVLHAVQADVPEK